MSQQCPIGQFLSDKEFFKVRQIEPVKKLLAELSRVAVVNFQHQNTSVC